MFGPTAAGGERWLYLHQLSDVATVGQLVEFYVTEHDERADGQTLYYVHARA